MSSKPSRVIEPLDEFFFDFVFQPLAYRLQGLAEPRQLALFLVMGIMVVTIANCTVLLQQSRFGITDAGTNALALIGSASYYYGCASLPSWSANPLRRIKAHRVFRLCALAVSIGVPLIDQNTGMLFAFDILTGPLLAGSIYFASCDKPPPARKKQPKAVVAVGT